MDLRYESYLNLLPQPRLNALLDLLADVFTNQSRSEWIADLNDQMARTPLLTLLAIRDGRVVGCKLGYERRSGQFYSWLGCVHPDARGQGIGAELMRRQHDWCRGQGYQTIRTQTYNHWRDMLILNLRFGFDIIGTEQSKRGLMIVLQKTL